jgi:hypothetical protein
MLDPFLNASKDELYAMQIHESKNIGQKSYEELNEFLLFLKERFVFYDPYRDRLINPFNNKTYRPGSTFIDFKIDKEYVSKMLSFSKPSEIEYQKFLNGRFKTARNLETVINLIQIIKVLILVFALISFVFLSWYYNLFLGLSLGFLLLSLPVGFYTLANSIGEVIDGFGATTLSYMRNKSKYQIRTIVLTLLSLTFSCIYFKSLIPIVFYSLFSFAIAPRLVKIYLSAVRYDKHITSRMEDLFE